MPIVSLPPKFASSVQAAEITCIHMHSLLRLDSCNAEFHFDSSCRSTELKAVHFTRGRTSSSPVTRLTSSTSPTSKARNRSPSPGTRKSPPRSRELPQHCHQQPNVHHVIISNGMSEHYTFCRADADHVHNFKARARTYTPVLICVQTA